MIDKFFSVFLEQWWWGTALSALTNFPTVVTVFSLVSMIILFFMLRYEHLRWQRMWALDGFEIFAAAGVGAVVTLSFYCLPVLIVSVVVCGLVVGLCQVFSFLVVLSCGEKK